MSSAKNCDSIVCSPPFQKGGGNPNFENFKKGGEPEKKFRGGGNQKGGERFSKTKGGEPNFLS